MVTQMPVKKMIQEVSQWAEKATMTAPRAPMMPKENIVQRRPIRSASQAEASRPRRSTRETPMKSVPTVSALMSSKPTSRSVCPQDCTVKDPRMKQKEPIETMSRGLRCLRNSSE